MWNPHNSKSKKARWMLKRWRETKMIHSFVWNGAIISFSVRASMFQEVEYVFGTYICMIIGQKNTFQISFSKLWQHIGLSRGNDRKIQIISAVIHCSDVLIFYLSIHRALVAHLRSYCDSLFRFEWVSKMEMWKVAETEIHGIFPVSNWTMNNNKYETTKRKPATTTATILTIPSSHNRNKRTISKWIKWNHLFFSFVLSLVVRGAAFWAFYCNMYVIYVVLKRNSANWTVFVCFGISLFRSHHQYIMLLFFFIKFSK